jgi:hypothetical protein
MGSTPANRISSCGETPSIPEQRWKLLKLEIFVFSPTFMIHKYHNGMFIIVVKIYTLVTQG